MKKQKYNFIEFIAATESEDFDCIDEMGLKFAKNQVNNSMPKALTTGIHFGDCNKHSITCPLCYYEQLLIEFKEYTFDEEKYRKNNL